MPPTATSSPRLAQRAAWALLAGAILWSYGGTLAGLIHRWWTEPDYVHGFLVPIFSFVILWNRRHVLPTLTLQGSWWGLAFLGLAALMRWASAYFYFGLIDAYSLVPCLAGVVLLIGGWQALRWAGPSILFLIFMVPAPGLVGDLLSHPLQRIGTITSTFILQTLGISAVAQGNVIFLTEGELGIAEACSGLRMMMLFLAVCVGATFFMKSGPWVKTLVILSAVPIALAANVMRITLTGVLYQLASHDVAEVVYHDLAGWLMMPLAVVLLWTELELLHRLTTVPEEKDVGLF
jgi:exosortase